MATVLQVAEYFLSTNPTHSISDLKLQKLCCYAQAISIAYLDRPLFSEKIEMWELGPVVRELYDHYKQYGAKPIPAVKLDLTPFSMEARLVLAAVNDYYGSLFDAASLCEQSHRDFPGIRGSNMILDNAILKLAFADNNVVLSLQRADKCQVPAGEGCTVSALEFLKNCVASVRR